METFGITSIKDAHSLETDTVTNIVARVIKNGPVVEYQKKDQTKMMRYFPTLVAASTGSTWIRVYQMHKLTLFEPATTVMLHGVIRKTGEEAFWCPSTTKSTSWANIAVPQAVLDSAEDTAKQEMGSPVRLLNMAIVAPSPSTVIGKITQTSPMKLMRNDELPTRFLRLMDDAAANPVKIALFGKDAEGPYLTGDVIKVSDAYPYKHGKSLSTKKQATVEFLPRDHLDIDISQVPMSDEPEFKDDSDITEEFEVMGVQSVYCYQCCYKPACRNKKVKDGKCPTCGNEPNEEVYYWSANLVIRRGANYSPLRLFKDNLHKLFVLPDNCKDYVSIVAEIRRQIPVTARGRFSNSNVEILTKKRSHDE